LCSLLAALLARDSRRAELVRAVVEEVVAADEVNVSAARAF
jgi:hypothetical protein